MCVVRGGGGSWARGGEAHRAKAVTYQGRPNWVVLYESIVLLYRTPHFFFRMHLDLARGSFGAVRPSPSTLPRATRSFEIWPSDTIFPLFLGPGIHIATNLCCLPSNCPGKSRKTLEKHRLFRT